jgi:D-sedoheptulose 7-phosphate isomerase
MVDHKKIIIKKLDSQQKTLKSTNLNNIKLIIDLISKAIKLKKTIFWAGNGGSAAECQHMSAELVGKFKINRRPFKSISLTVDTSAITAISNDYGYDRVFSRQIEGIGTKGDILIVLSTSGNSKNIIQLLKTSKKMNIITIAFLGNKGGKCKEFSDHNIIINSKNTAEIQELHQIILHFICETIEKMSYQ